MCAVAANGDVYWTELGCNCVRKWSASDQTATTIAGSPSGGAGFADGPAADARFNYPAGIALQVGVRKGVWFNVG